VHVLVEMLLEDGEGNVGRRGGGVSLSNLNYWWLDGGDG
jgi:hypothetical protein